MYTISTRSLSSNMKATGLMFYWKLVCSNCGHIFIQYAVYSYVAPLLSNICNVGKSMTKKTSAP